MKIMIDTDILNSNGITADEYLFLYAFYHKEEECLKQTVIGLDNLQTKGYLKITDEGVVLRSEAIKLFQVSDKEAKFLEFFNSFPLKVPASNGATRPLRAATSDAKSAQETREKYYRLLKAYPNIHDQVMAVLDAEKNMRRRSNTFAYMHNINTWLHQADYEKYEYLLGEKKEPESKVEGI